jgi:hypothetical protein
MEMDRSVTHRRIEVGSPLRHLGESDHAFLCFTPSRWRAGLQATSTALRHDNDDGASRTYVDTDRDEIGRPSSQSDAAV